MPTYEYQCESCGHRFEAFQKMSDDPIAICPECGGSVRRLLGTGGGFIFKSSGFYETDYRSDSPKTRCGNISPCCGRDVPCSRPPCE